MWEAAWIIAIEAGTDVAIESADIVPVRNDPRDVPTVIDFARRTYRKVVQNFAWATGYNAIAIPLAAGPPTTSEYSYYQPWGPAHVGRTVNSSG